MEHLAPSPEHSLATVADGVVVVGASAGGVEALVSFVGALPAGTTTSGSSPAGLAVVPQPPLVALPDAPPRSGVGHR